jgi:hypothetical protein
VADLGRSAKFMKSAAIIVGLILSNVLRGETTPENLQHVPAAPTSPQALVSLLGVETWSLQVPAPGGHDYQVALFAKIPGRSPVRLTEGVVIRAKKKFPSNFVTVEIAVAGLWTSPRQAKLQIGIFAGYRIHCLVENPFPKGMATLSEGPDCYMDEKGRIALVQGAKEVLGACPFVDGQEMSLYLQRDLWDETIKEPNKALVPTPASVTPAASAPVAPDAGAAHL